MKKKNEVELVEFVIKQNKITEQLFELIKEQIGILIERVEKLEKKNV